MKISVDNTLFTLDDKYATYSPYLRTLLETDVGIDTEEDAVVVDADVRSFSAYCSFLQGEDFEMDEEIAAAFDFFGHSNRQQYSLDVWKMKLHDNWVRDMFHRLELWRDPLYDLQEVPIVRPLPKCVEEYLAEYSGWYVAGGAALWMAGHGHKFSDIDLFTCMPKDEANKSLVAISREKNGDNYLTITGNSVTVHLVNDNLQDGGKFKYPVQHILRLYSSPSETVHGFDLDCVGFLYMNGKLYATKRALHSVQAQTNWFDPARASPSYAYRLAKYKGRGYNIFLPYVTNSNIVWRTLRYMVRNMTGETFDLNYGEEHQYHPGILSIQKVWQKLGAPKTLNDMAKFQSQLPGKPSDGEIVAYSNPAQNKKFVYSPVDVLLLAQYADFFVTSHMQTSDYEYAGKHKDGPEIPPIGADRGIPASKKWQYDGEGDDAVFTLRPERLHWREQDPGAQVSSTCYPTPIEDLRKWYAQSSAYSA